MRYGFVLFSKKYLIVFAAIVLPVVMLGILMAKEMEEVARAFKSLRLKTIPAVEILGDIDAATSRFRIVELQRLLADNSQDIAESDKVLSLTLQEIGALRNNYDKLDKNKNISELTKYLDKELGEYIDAHNKMMHFIMDGNKKDARLLAYTTVEQEFLDVSSVLHVIIDKHKETAVSVEKTIAHDEFVSKSIAFMLFAASIAIATLTAFLYRRVEINNYRLENQLFTDSLTQLPNRNSLIHTLKESKNGILVLVNIDDFSQINDFYGYEIGDSVLVWMADRLKNKNYGIGYSVFRMPSDEFAIHVNNIENENEHGFMKKVADLLFSQTMTCECDGHSILIRLTIGISKGEGESLLTQADVALKKAKLARQHYLVYEESMNPTQEHRKNIEWAKKLDDAISDNRIIVYYQPIFDNKTGAVAKYESLVRLIDESGKIVSPYIFLDIAKKSRLYYHITHIVASKAIDFFKDRTESVSINLSFEDIADERTRKFLLLLLKQSGMADRVIFEILESEGIENFDMVSDFIKAAKELGCMIAIDDFGSGYSNFDTILKLNIDILKIDGSLIKEIDKNENAKKIVKTIIGFTKELNLKTVAEFVHSESVYNELLTLGIDFSQGFYLSEPISQERLLEKS